MLLLAADGLPIDIPATFLRVLHIGAAIVAAGGAFFQFVALHPTLATLPAEQRRPIREAVVDRWRGVVFAAIGLLLITGLVNFVVYKIPEYKPLPTNVKMVYHSLFGLKFLAALAAFHAATVLVLPGPKGERYRDNAGFWLKYLAVVLTLVVILGAAMRNFTPHAT
jgi:uncharacterized membrane protein